MGNITFRQFADAAGLPDDVAEKWYQPFLDTFSKYSINTPLRIAHFIAQTGHESAGFTLLRENLNYSESALLAQFPRRITPAQAKAYGRNAAHPADQQAIGNIIYAGRNGNGDQASGDGFKFRGGGLIQTTGRANYRSAGYENSPAEIALPDGAVDSAGYYWSAHRLNVLADQDDLAAVTRAINGGLTGLSDRAQRLVKAKKYLGVS